MIIDITESKPRKPKCLCKISASGVTKLCEKCANSFIITLFDYKKNKKTILRK